MTKQGPGLGYEPPAETLAGFRSLMPPPPPKKPGVLRRILKAPFRLLALPLELVGKVLRAPFRMVKGNRRSEADHT